MIAVVDIGNTRTKCAVYGTDGLVLADSIFPTTAGISPEVESFFDLTLGLAVIGSVVPAMNGPWMEFFSSHASQVHLASASSPWGFEVGVEEPDRVGVDRLAALEGALSFPGAVVVVDAGTATKLDLLEGVERRRFAGGAIAPGVQIGLDALVSRTAQLPSIDLSKHSPVVGYNTETAIRSGVLHGFAAMVDGMVLRIFEERKLPISTAVVATGGNSAYLQGRARLVTHHRPRLTLEGLYAIARKV